MAEAVQQDLETGLSQPAKVYKNGPQSKRRAAEPGTRRVTITLQEDDYKALVEFAKNEMREPNNMLSYLLKGRIKGMLAEDKAE